MNWFSGCDNFLFGIDARNQMVYLTISFLLAGRGVAYVLDPDAPIR